MQRYVTPPDPLPDFPPYRQAKNSRATSTLNVDPTIQNSTGSSTLATAPTTFAQSCVSGGTFYVFFIAECETHAPPPAKTSSSAAAFAPSNATSQTNSPRAQHPA